METGCKKWFLFITRRLIRVITKMAIGAPPYGEAEDNDHINARLINEVIETLENFGV